jgi:hypothetical protein
MSVWPAHCVTLNDGDGKLVSGLNVKHVAHVQREGNRVTITLASGHNIIQTFTQGEKIATEYVQAVAANMGLP